ncbi:MAG TPA: SH3 domain-containing protein [Burkholderiales bacterium]|nr:SH3 domain-containing protein [Burkholderiales bacterium]
MARVLVLLLGGALSFGALATDYRSVGQSAAILYDAPSTHARKLYVASRQLPVEIISSDGAWVKVRDPQGDLAWSGRGALSEQRTVVVTAGVADIRQHPDSQSPVVFQAQQGVVLELQASTVPGWLHVRHADGSAGYVRLNQVWGG